MLMNIFEDIVEDNRCIASYIVERFIHFNMYIFFMNMTKWLFTLPLQSLRNALSSFGN